MRLRNSTALAVLALAATATGCGGGSSSGTSGGGSTGSPSPSPSASSSAAAAAANGISCHAAGNLAATPQHQPPANVPVIPGGHVYLSKGPFGKTQLFFEAVKADPTNLDGPRDQTIRQLTKAGWKLLRKDQEEGSEAEAHFAGKNGATLDVQVIQLCEGTVRVKYNVSQ